MPPAVVDAPKPPAVVEVPAWNPPEIVVPAVEEDKNSIEALQKLSPAMIWSRLEHKKSGEEIVSIAEQLNEKGHNGKDKFKGALLLEKIFESSFAFSTAKEVAQVLSTASGYTLWNKLLCPT